MDTQVDTRDWQLLEKDKYTFAVVSRILHSACKVIRTDHKRLIVCLSAAPFPVWIWTPDDTSKEEKERAWQEVCQVLPLTDGYRYNMKYELAAYFLAKAREQGVSLAIAKNMLAYDCPTPIAPDKGTDGHIHWCTADDVEQAATILQMFHTEVAVDSMTKEEIVARVQELIGCKRLYFWKDGCNRTVASCYYVPNDDVASISGVYTLPAYRRNHYAQHLVYQVTKIIANTGAMPMLYTDADYAASNACYEKIGYVARGKLCTLEIVNGENKSNR